MANLTFDQLNRPLHDVRISVIDRCNFRCPYCMPEAEYSKHYSFLKEKQWLTFTEIVRLTKIFTQLGAKKVRITGGEPLLRPGVCDLIEELAQIKEIEDLALTTNGSLLGKYADDLKAAGLQRLTVSLDTLDSRIFKQMSGGKGRLSQVLDGIKEAERAGFQKIKINVVVQKGVNDQTILDLVKYFKNSGHILRFIEYMDVGNCNHWLEEYVVPSKKIVEMIHSHAPLEPIKANYYGEVAERYRFKDGSGEVGFISSISQPFCRDCTRLRLSTDGKLFTCLFASTGTDLLGPLRGEVSDNRITNIIKNIWKKRKDRYSELRSEPLKENSQHEKIEMFQIGG